MPPAIAAVAVGVLAGASAAIAGASLVAAILIGAGAALFSGLSTLLTPSLEPPKLSPLSSADRLQKRTVTVRDPVRSRDMVYGRTRKGGTIIEFITSTDDSKELNLVIALAGHECEAIQEVYFGEDLAFDSSGVVQPKFTDKAFVTKYLGTSTQTADAGLMARSSRWTSAHRLRGICYIVVLLIFDRDLYAAVPNVSAIVKGKKVFDPRSGLTVWSDNAALCQADYLNDPTYGLAIPYSGGSPAPEIDVIDEAVLIAAANICDESVSVPPFTGSPPTPSTEKRYLLNGVIDSAEEPESNLTKMLSASYGRALYVGGEWLVKAGAFETPTLGFDEDDLRGNVVVQPRVPRRDLFNAVRGIFVSEKNNFQPADFPPVTSTTFQTQDNGERIWRDVELPFTATETMAQRIAKIHLFAMREQISVIYPCSLKALQVNVGDTVMITNARMGWTDKIFLVTDWSFAVVQDEEGAPLLGCNMQLRETSAAVYDITASEQDLIAAAPDTLLPSPANVEFWAVQIDGRGQFATSSVLAGFEAIINGQQAPTWPGRLGSPSGMVGLVYNPRTGHLNCQDQNLATGNNQDVFDQYVVTPVLNPSYTTEELDITFDDNVRIIAPLVSQKGPGEPGAFSALVEFDYRLDAGAFVGFSPLRVQSATGMHFKFRAVFDTSEGAAMIVKSFNPTIAKRLVVHKVSSVVIPVGGKSFVFDTPYHKTPTVGANVHASAGRSVVFPEIDRLGFTGKVFDASSDVGGTIGWRSEGV
jgi:hypothetical protein